MDADVFRSQLGAIAMHALEHQPENLAELHGRMAAAETMLHGLPNLVAAMGEIAGLDDEAVAILQAMLDEAEAEGDTYDVVSDTEKILATALKTTLRQQQIIAKSVKALAKTQLGLARACQHYGSMLLIWVASADFQKAAAELGAKAGRDDAIHRYAKQRFGDTFGAPSAKQEQEESGDDDEE